MIRRHYPTLESAVEVLRTSGYQPTTLDPRKWIYKNGTEEGAETLDEVEVTPLSDEFPIPTLIS